MTRPSLRQVQSRAARNTHLTGGSAHALAVLAVCWAAAQPGYAAVYRFVPGSTAAAPVPGAILSLRAEVETEAGDNLVGVGHFSFAIDITVGGTAGAAADAIGNVVINEAVFDDVLSNFTGAASGMNYVGIAGVTTDVFPPNPGASVGDVVPLFTFELAVPVGAHPGDTITLSPREGFLENLTVNDAFDPVSPQRFEDLTIVVVPEPSVVPALLLLCWLTARCRSSPWWRLSSLGRERGGAPRR